MMATLEWRHIDREPGFVRRLIEAQIRLTHRFDRLIPADLRVDGNRDFIERIVPRYLRPGSTVYDVGCGKNPVISQRQKSELRLKVTGLDVDADEMREAAPGTYDETICVDLTTYQGRSDADLVICQSLLEHVRDVEAAIRAISSILRRGGRALIFTPCRNALYARLNRMLPQDFKRRLLFAIFPEMRRSHGFPAFYDRCTAYDLQQLAFRYDLITESLSAYFESGYFRFCLPIHVAWRIGVLTFRLAAGDQAAETMSLVLRKQEARHEP
jgi:2-polyprenyl-6-hydroxyphenyl methylase/3-demethylubiquinone-9 3-methyltransferase